MQRFKLWGVFQKNTNVELIQTGGNETDDFGYCNVSAVRYPNGSLIISDIAMTKRNHEFNYTITSPNITDLGRYLVNGYCGWTDGEQTTFTYDFIVTYTGEQVSLSNVIIVIGFLLLAGVCLALGWAFNKEHWLLKTFFYFCAVLMGIISLNSGRIIASESEGLSKMGNMGLLIFIVIFSIFFIYMFVYYFIETIKSFREKRGVRWNYD